MSRDLPERPSLVHLKEQAKDRLAAMRRDAPDAQFADALHAVAQEYGFSTWPDLKAHVERVASDAGMPAAGPSSIAGRWIADGASLRSLGVTPPASATLDFTIVGARVTIVQSSVDDAGREERATSAIDVDGIEHRYAESSYGILARWIGRSLDVATTLDGAPVSRVTYSVADDGASLTLSAASVAHDGFPATRHHAEFTRQTFR